MWIQGRKWNWQLSTLLRRRLRSSRGTKTPLPNNKGTTTGFRFHALLSSARTKVRFGRAADERRSATRTLSCSCGLRLSHDLSSKEEVRLEETTMDRSPSGTSSPTSSCARCSPATVSRWRSPLPERQPTRTESAEPLQCYVVYEVLENRGRWWRRRIS